VSGATDRIVFHDVSKFYGEVLGVKRVSLEIPPGLTGLVGPNGSGKSTLMHLTSGLLRPSRGEVSVLGISPSRPEQLFPLVGYCTQYDTFPAGATGLGFLTMALALHGRDRADAREQAWKVIEQVGMTDAARRRIAGYSKGMRQRIKLAHALAHSPQVLILDEPLNGLDPMARSEMIALMRHLAEAGRHVIVSSHILDELNQASDQVIMIHGGSVLAEGEIPKVRGEITRHPIQVLIRCDKVHALAARIFALEHVVEAKMLAEGEGLLVRTKDADGFLTSLNRMVLEAGIVVETVAPADDTVNAVYEYLIGGDGGGS